MNMLPKGISILAFRYLMASGLTRPHRILKKSDIAAGRSSRWTEMEFTGFSFLIYRDSNLMTGNDAGSIRVLPPELFTDFTHLTSLHLNNNELKHLPPAISNVCLCLCIMKF